MAFTHVKIAAKITRHEQKENQSAACTFIFDSGNIYTEYTIRVSITSPPLPFEPINVRRRFSEFRKLYTELLALGQGPRVMARFPGRSPLKNNMSEDFLLERLHGLQGFLDAILATPISPERLVNWEDPISHFLSLARLFTPPNDLHSERGASLAHRPDFDPKNLEQEFEELKDGFEKINKATKAIEEGSVYVETKETVIKPPSKPKAPTMEQVRASAAKRLTRVARGYIGRRKVWRLRLDRARPMYVNISSINGFAKGGVSSIAFSYSPFVMVTCIDSSSGKQLCGGRSSTRPATTQTDWDWDVEEMILLPTVYPDSTLVFTILDQTSLGRHNFLAQASVTLTPKLANITSAMVDAFKRQSKLTGGGGLVPPPPTSALVQPNSLPPQNRGLFGGRSASTASALPAPPPPPRASYGNARAPSVSNRVSVDGLGGSNHFKALKPPNELELSLGIQLQEVWFDGCTELSSSPRATLNMGLSTSEHGQPRSLAVPPYWSSSPEIFTKLRQWDFGTCHASFKWCPMHASKCGVLYRLSEPSSFRRQTWMSTYVVLTQDEIVLFSNEGDSRALKRKRVECISKVAATSATVVASGVATPTELSDPWDAVITIQFEDNEGDWQLLSLEGSKGQNKWRKRINEAIFHHASNSRYSIGAGVSGSLTTSAVAGFDLGFLPPTRERLPSADSIISSASTMKTSATPRKESATDYRLSSDSPRTSSDMGGGSGLLRPRSSSVESPSPFGFNDLIVDPKNRNNTSMAPSLRLSYGL